MNHPTCLHLYAEPTAATLHLSEIVDYVKRIVPFLDIKVRESFIPSYLSSLSAEEREEAMLNLARQFAAAKVRNLIRQEQGPPPLPGEVDYERRRLSDPGSKAFGILYDGFKLMQLLKFLLPGGERSLESIHVVFTNQLFGTWDEGDRRYHARASVYGFPSLLSTSGIVEAPAKPRHYYLLKQQYASLGAADAAAVLGEEFRSRFIDYEDKRLTEVMKGYVMQAIAFHLWGDPFCDDKGCRLYNAHWQEEVIRAQLESDYEFCPEHQKRWEELKNR